METPLWSESISIEEEYIGIFKGRRKGNVENTNKEVKGKSSEK